MIRNYYAELNIPNFSSFFELAAAYRRKYNEVMNSDAPLEQIAYLSELKQIIEALKDEAEKQKYDEALRKELKRAEKNFEEAVILLQEGKFQQSLEKIKACIEFNPKKAEYYETMGVIYGLIEEFNLSINAFKKAHELDKNNPLYLWYIADAYYNYSDKENALKYYEQAVNLLEKKLAENEKDIKSLEILSDIYVKLQWYDEALKIFDSLKRLEPNNPNYSRDYARVLYDLNILDEAEENLKKALEIEPNDSISHLFLGLVYFKKHLLSKSIASLKKSLLIDPEQTEAKMLLDKIIKIKEKLGETIEEIITNGVDENIPYHEGTVKWYNSENGIGMITSDKYDNIFLHYFALPKNLVDTLKKGDKVKFAIIEDKMGPLAVNVSLSNETNNEFYGKVITLNKTMGVVEANGEKYYFLFNNTKDIGPIKIGAKVKFKILDNSGETDIKKIDIIKVCE